MVNQIAVWKAQAIGSQKIIPVTLEIHEELPENSPQPETFERDAQSIFEALRSTLPGGTFDRLVVKMLEFKVSILRIPAQKGEKND